MEYEMDLDLNYLTNLLYFINLFLYLIARTKKTTKYKIFFLH